jgi:hypothetical protein
MKANNEQGNESSFRRLLELGDQEHREALSDLYIVSESRLNNFIDCLEKGKKEIDSLRAVNKELLEALKQAKDELTYYLPETWQTVGKVAEAITKAEGKGKVG